MVQAMQFFRGNTDDGLANLCLEMIANPLYVNIDIHRNVLNVQNNVPSINEKSSSGPRINGTTKYV